MGLSSFLRCFKPEAGIETRSSCPASEANQSALLDTERSYLVQLTLALHNCTVAKPSPLQQSELALEVVKTQLGLAAASLAVFSGSCETYTVLVSCGCKSLDTLEPQALGTTSSCCIAQAYRKGEAVYRSVNRKGSMEIDACFTKRNFKSLAALPVVLGDQKQGVLLLCSTEADTFQSDRQRAAIQVVQCWLAQAFRDGCMRAYSTHLEKIGGTGNFSDTVQALTLSVSSCLEGPGCSTKIFCSVAVVSDDGLSAMHYGLAGNGMLEGRSFNTRGGGDSSDTLHLPASKNSFGCVPLYSGSTSYSDVLPTTSNLCQLDCQAYRLEGTVLADVVKKRAGAVLADCMPLLQERTSRLEELLLTTASPTTSALLVEALFDEDGQPRLGVYVTLPKSAGQMFLQGVADRLQEQLRVLKKVVLRKFAVFQQPGTNSFCFSSSLSQGAASDLSANYVSGETLPPGRISGSRGSTQRLMPLVCGLQDQLHSLQRINTQAQANDKPSDMRMLKLSTLVGKGSFGLVFRGSYCGMDLAVKVIPWRDSDSCVMLKAVELAVLTTLNHPNIVQVSTFFPEAMLVQPQVRQSSGMPTSPWLVPPHEWDEEARKHGKGTKNAMAMRSLVICMEYCDLGTLQDAIVHGCFQKNRPPPGGEAASKPVPHLRNILLVLMETAWALAYLHRMHLVHRDIKPSNILLKASLTDPRGYTTKLSDFGLVKVMTDKGAEGEQQSLNASSTGDITASHPAITITLTGEQGVSAQPSAASIRARMHFSGTVTHCAPEVMTAPKDTPASGTADIYAFGILMWELYTSTSAYPRMTSEEIYHMVVNEGLRPEFPITCPPEFTALAEKCWTADTAARPTADQVVLMLEQLMRKVMSRSAQHRSGSSSSSAKRVPSRLRPGAKTAELREALRPRAMAQPKPQAADSFPDDLDRSTSLAILHSASQNLNDMDDTANAPEHEASTSDVNGAGTSSIGEPHPNADLPSPVNSNLGLVSGYASSDLDPGNGSGNLDPGNRSGHLDPGNSWDSLGKAAAKLPDDLVPFTKIGKAGAGENVMAKLNYGPAAVAPSLSRVPELPTASGSGNGPGLTTSPSTQKRQQPIMVKLNTHAGGL